MKISIKSSWTFGKEKKIGKKTKKDVHVSMHVYKKNVKGVIVL